MVLIGSGAFWVSYLVILVGSFLIWVILSGSDGGSRPGMDIASKLQTIFLLLLGGPSLTRPTEALFQPPAVMIEQRHCDVGRRRRRYRPRLAGNLLDGLLRSAGRSPLPRGDELARLQHDPSDEYSCGEARAVSRQRAESAEPWAFAQ